ncbi:kinesin-like protein [Dunaliella salina]|uniref:Kinesin-like protein n=1 Tax=Dunaliella salina TaxID=3046 RepID=A0ABQ7GVN2_DUNSA|nr:kinesin-like protein [Dunaliella salina]|eukprot:KAF5838673.1 kinesin-like protein [Dunaliella salina]
MHSEERRTSRIPRPSRPSSTGTPLQEKSPNVQFGQNSERRLTTTDRKRKAAGLDVVPEHAASAKRPARAGSAQPARSAPAPNRSAPTPSGGLSFHSEGNNAKATGPAPGEETFEEIQDRTGASELDILNKKMAFKRGMKPEKKIEEMAPMVKELSQAEAGSAKLNSDLAAAESLINTKSQALQAAEQQLECTRDDLAKATSTLADRENKIQGMEDVVRQSQAYSTTLQTYNTSLQNDLKEEKMKRDEASRERDMLQAPRASPRLTLAEALLGGYPTLAICQRRSLLISFCPFFLSFRLSFLSLQHQRPSCMQLCTTACAVYHALLVRCAWSMMAAGGKSLENLESLTNDKATMEVQLSMQQKMLSEMRNEVALSKEQKAMAESSAGTRSTQITELQGQVGQLQHALTDAERRVLEGEMVRRKLHNIIQELKGNIRVFCRVRPIGGPERPGEPDSQAMSVEFPESNDLLRAGITLQTQPRGDVPGGPVKQSFQFDRVFSPTSTQASVFEEISELVQSALDGHKVCIFAYGQTGSGKTHTMLGTPDDPGMIPLAMHQIFDTSRKLGSQGWSFNMQASMLEIYNEEYRDLLTRARRDDKKHQVIHNQDGSTTVTELTTIDVSTPEKVDALLSEAMNKRTVGCTALNEQSSRSHMVFTLKIDGTNSSTGCERMKDSGAQAMKEAQNINKSLSSLGDVIVAIGNKDKHVPFRNSKLTYLLQPCLGGDAKTLMFVNITPSREFAGESLCSLRFASKVNDCVIKDARKQQAKS